MERLFERPDRPDILLRAFDLLETVESPGAIVHLPFEWPDPNWQDEVRKTSAMTRPLMRQRVDSEFEGDRNFAVQECVDV